jgi:hypothetical protein
MRQRGRRSAAELSVLPVYEPKGLECPPELTEIERKIFQRIVGSRPPDYFQDDDIDLLAAYCSACARERRASAALASSPLDEEWADAAAQAVKAMNVLAGKLRIGAQGRYCRDAKMPVQLDHYGNPIR